MDRIAGLLFVILIFSTVVPAMAETFSSPANISKSRISSAPSIATDGTNLYAVWNDNTPRNNEILFSSTNITPVNSPPTASAVATPNPANELDIVTLDGTASSDPDGTIVSYNWTQTAGTPVTLYTTNPTNPTFTAPSVGHAAVLVATGYGAVFFMAPSVGHAGDTLTFSLVVTDDLGATSTPATVDITINNVNQPPTADSQSVSTPEDTQLEITLTGSDPDGDSLAFTISRAPSHGTLSGTAPNLTYTPDQNYFGPDSFDFVANDGTADSNIATVDITVTQVIDEPQEFKQDAQSMLSDVIGSIDGASDIGDIKDAKKKLNKALGRISDSLAPNLWIDTEHVDAILGGDIFNKERQAVKEIFGGIKKGDIENDSILNDLDVIIRKLIDADRLLAEIAINDAQNDLGADAKKIDKALDKLSNADDLVSAADLEDNPDDKAKILEKVIKEYRAAWKEATKSVFGNISDSNEDDDDKEKTKSYNFGT